MTTPTNQAPTGGLHVAWILGDEPRSFRTKDGGERTVVELRDPSRLSHSLVIWLDGPAAGLAPVAPGSLIQLWVESVRSGRARNELVARVSREAVEAAFGHAGKVAK